MASVAGEGPAVIFSVHQVLTGVGGGRGVVRARDFPSIRCGGRGTLAGRRGTQGGWDMIGMEHANLATVGPLIAFASVLAGSLSVPIPTFAGLIFVGSLLAEAPGDRGGLAALVFLAAMTGAALGDAAWFGVGRRHGGRVLGLLCRVSWTKDSCVRRTADFFERHGVRLFLVARFLPGLSTLGAPIAGASGVAFHKFFLHAAAGAALWIGTGLILGYLLADQVSMLLLAFTRFGLDLGAAAAVMVLGYIGFAWLRRQRLRRPMRMGRVTAESLNEMVAAGLAPALIDARSSYQRGVDPFLILGALLWQQVEAAPATLPSPSDPKAARPVVVYCACPDEASAVTVARRLLKLGYADVRPLRGGLDAWRAAGRPVVPIAAAPLVTAAPARGAPGAARRDPARASSRQRARPWSDPP